MKKILSKKIRIKLLAIFMLIIQIISLGTSFNISNAEIKDSDNVMLKGDHECDSLVEFYLASTNRMSYKIVWYVYYEDGQKYPAFCVEPAKEGIGTGYSQYEASIIKEEDNRIWRIMQKGYMGTKWTDWDLESDDDFYSATKIALHSLAENIAPKDKYVLGTRSVDGNSVEEIQRRGRKTLEVAQILYEYGINGTETYVSPKIEIKKVGEYKIEKIDDTKYYIQSYKIDSNKYLKSYDIEIKDFTLNTIVLDSNNNPIVEKNKISNKEFKIAIPITEIKSSINGTISITNAEVKTNPVFYAKSSIPKAQSYVTYSSGYEKTQDSKTLKIDPRNCNIRIVKVDGENYKQLENVEFEILSNNEECLGKYTTDEKGIIKIENLMPGSYKIKETKTKEEYILDETEIKIDLIWGKTFELEVKNFVKKGMVKITKIDEQDNNIKINGVEFELIKDNNEKIGKYTTNENGEILINDLEYGKYKVKEINTNEAYILDETEHYFEIKNNNEIVELNITNKQKPKLPRTGF